MKRFLSSAVFALALILPACRSSDPAPPIAASGENPGVEQTVRDYIAASQRGDAPTRVAMYVERVRNHPDLERFLVGESENLRTVGNLDALKYVDEIPGSQGVTHAFHADFAEIAAKVFVQVDPASGLLEFLSVEPLPAGQTSDPRDRFEARLFEDGTNVLPYRLRIPDGYDPNERYPLVLFFHGAGQRGDENIRQVAYGVWGFSGSEILKRHPSFLVAPQCPEDDQWVDTPWVADSHSMPEHPTTPLRLSLELLDALQEEFSIDANRVYVTGMSMGGFGTWDAIQRHPERFAAALPICGGGDPAFSEQLADVPIWAFHGDADAVVKVERSRDMVAAIQAAGGTPRYTELPGVGHDSWVTAYTADDVFDWLFAQTLADR